ncbi:MAG: ribonuclease domain-containing protein [Pirellulaceae bacterium]
MKRLGQRLVMVVVVVLLAGWVRWQQTGGHTPAQRPAPATSAPSSGSSELPDGLAGDATREVPSSRRTLMQGVTIRDRDGRVVYRGEVDLSGTLSRIEANERLSFPRDGSVFQNRERRLPLKPAGHYREWVHPTADLAGPGPQRIVTGKDGEAYYTPDHYETFQRIR